MIQVEQSIIYQVGRRSDVVVAAPHHGYIPGCDYYTKEVAAMLAGELGAALVVAENMRPLVDLNKDPELAPTPETRNLCLTYQQYALAGQVSLFLELHGHVNGNYDVEISCGFTPDPLYAFDRELIARLLALKTALQNQLDQGWRSDLILPPPSIGIYPFDPDVVMKATRTYLFRKIRYEQLNLRRIFGIHIEISKDYKSGKFDTPTYLCQKALVKYLAEGIKEAFSLEPVL